MRLNMPSKLQRAGLLLNPRKRAQALLVAAAEIERCVNEDFFPSLLDLYCESYERFNALRMIAPWMDEACKTLEGLRLARRSEMRLEAGDAKKAKDLLARSADAGDGESAFRLFNTLDKSSEEALFYLDIAVKCNIPEALAEMAIMVEDGLKGRGSAAKLSLKAIWKGSSRAYENLKVMRLGPFKRIWLAKAKFAADVLNLKEGG
jgi:hypothetical protein